MRWLSLSFLLLVAGNGPAAGATSLNLGQYALRGAYALPAAVLEASGVTYNWDRDSFVVIDDGGTNLVEIDRTGQRLREVHLTGYPVQGGLNAHDIEAVTYVGNGVYAIASERNRNVHVFSTAFPAEGETIDLAVRGKRIALFGPDDDVGNSGLEGLSYNPLTGAFFAVKEKSSSEFYRFIYDSATLVPTVTQPFTKNQVKAWNLGDFSDVQSLGTVPVFAGTSLADNFLLISQESSRLLEIDGTAAVLGALDLDGFTAGWNVEGVTIDFSGAIYVVGENAVKGSPARLFVFAPVPEPAVTALFVVAGGLALLRRARRAVSSASAARR